MILFDTGKNKNKLTNFSINGQLIDFTENTKFLGILLNANLKWNNHIEYILQKARKGLNLLKVISSQN